MKRAGIPPAPRLGFLPIRETRWESYLSRLHAGDRCRVYLPTWEPRDGLSMPAQLRSDPTLAGGTPPGIEDVFCLHLLSAVFFARLLTAFDESPDPTRILFPEAP